MSARRIVLLGPPGAGKGTQAARVAAALDIPAISTGDLFRSHIAGGTELGRTVQAFTSRGELVPDEVTNAMVADRLAADDAREGFLLDGYPRNVAQVDELERMLEAAGTSLDVAVELVADVDVVVERLVQRATLEGREDDDEKVVRHRMAVYAEQTAPVAGVYATRDQLVQVDGIGSVDDVTARLLAALGHEGT